METLTVLKTRRSCRAYQSRLIEPEKLEAIIEAGTYAATGMGRQSPIIIAVTDNGKGFNPDEADTADGTHIGLRNVRARIEMLCGGTLSIESREGEGTTVIIRIPE